MGANGRVLVLDIRNRRISEYARANNRLAHVRDVRLPHRTTDFCILGERLFTVGAPAERELIQEIGSAGNVVRSFARREEPPRALLERLGTRAGQILRSEYNVAGLYCDPPSNRVIVQYWGAPIVRAYSPDGALLWSKELPEFYYPEPGVAHAGALEWRFNGSTGLWSSGKAVFMDQNDHLFVSFGVRELRGVGWVDTRVLSSTNGANVERFKGDEVWATASGDYVYGYRQHPFPQVVKYKLRHSNR